MVKSTSSKGTAVAFSATAVDIVSGNITVTFNRVSGSTFVIGTTTVTATAKDAAGNTATCTFTITVTPGQSSVNGFHLMVECRRDIYVPEADRHAARVVKVNSVPPRERSGLPGVIRLNGERTLSGSSAYISKWPVLRSSNEDFPLAYLGELPLSLIPLGITTMSKIDLLQGTLDLLILRVLQGGPQHGWGIAQRLFLLSGEKLKVEEGALYPALHRVERKAWIKAEWRPSDNNRRAKYYQLTAAGRRQLATEREDWKRLTAVMAQILDAPP